MRRRLGEELSSLVATGADIEDAASHTVIPAPSALDENFTVVRAALHRAAMATPKGVHAPGRPPDAWWRRRFAIASMSLPVTGVLALLVFGAAGAAAATVGVTAAARGNNPVTAIRHIPQVAFDAVKPGSPSTPVANLGATQTATAPSPVLGGAQPAAATPEGGSVVGPVPGVLSTASTTHSDTATATPSPTGAAPPLTDAPPTASAASTTVNGTIIEVHGNTFTLATTAGDFNVQVDAKTDLSGEIAVNALATVRGVLTGKQNIHADSVVVAQSAAEGAAATPTAPEASTPVLASTHTPGPPQGKGPQTTHTPPGQGGGNGNGKSP